MYLLSLFNIILAIFSISIIEYTVFISLLKTKISFIHYLIFLLLETLITLITGASGRIFHVILLVLMAQFILKSTQNINLIFFYALYTIISTTVFGAIIQSLENLLATDFLIQDASSIFDTIVTPLFLTIIQYFIIKYLTPSLLILRKNRNLQQHVTFKLMNLLLFLSLIFYTATYIFNISGYKHIVNLFFAYCLIIILVYLHYITRSHLNQQIIDQKQLQLDNLTHYTQQIEELYHSLNGFRHDYANLMISLEESIQTNNMTHVHHIYNDVLKSAKLKLGHNNYTLSTLRAIEIPAIKSLLSHKIIDALEKGIRTEIEIEQQWTSCHMDTLDYIRILGILLDNAIEASENTANAFIHIAVLIDPVQKENRFIIENATTEETSAIHQLFKHSVTTKENGHGTGLHNVQQILIDYEQAHLETAHANHKFSQTLVTQG